MATNAAAPLTTPTPDESGQMVHPSIYDGGAGKWNGYRYWMAATPYPNNNATVEKPCILVSDDKTTWIVPAGGTNPIEDVIRPDPDIVVDADGRMWCIDTGNTGGAILIRSSTDGITWPASITLITAGTDDLISPSLVYYGDQWLMFSVNFDSVTPTNSTVERRTCATPNGTWSSPVTVPIATIPTGRYPWHLDVIADGSTLYMALNVSAQTLYLAYSTDGGLTWRLDQTPMINGKAGAWDVNIYRSTFLRTATGFDVWYSANDNGSPTKNWFTGYVFVPYPQIGP